MIIPKCPWVCKRAAGDVEHYECLAMRWMYYLLFGNFGIIID
jgi:hypothetical protein